MPQGQIVIGEVHGPEQAPTAMSRMADPPRTSNG